MTRRAAIVAALTMLFYVGLFCDPAQFAVSDLRTSLTR